VKALRTIFALALLLGMLPAAPAAAGWGSVHVADAHARQPVLSAVIPSDELELTASPAPHAPARDLAAPAPEAGPVFTRVALLGDERVPHRSPNLGETDRCRDP
jgi:hypothetical protein